MTPNTAVRLTAQAALQFPDLAGRPGVLLRVEGWAVCDWNGMQVRLPVEALEPVA